MLRDLERPDPRRRKRAREGGGDAVRRAARAGAAADRAEVDLGFFPLLVLHTRQGFFADPIYGGNRDRVGWDVIGFPGPASLAEAHAGRYSTLPYFADDREHPIAKEEAS